MPPIEDRLMIEPPRVISGTAHFIPQKIAN